jgi:hypothetical protein
MAKNRRESPLRLKSKTHPAMNPMKHSLIAALGICAVTLPLRAEILKFDLSPAGTSPAVGLSPANEVPVATGTGSGGKLFPGITFNTDTNLLSVTVGYGSYFGFTDLTGAATMAHIHGPATVTQAAGVIHDFFAAGQHLFAPVPTTGGIIVGGVTLTAAQKTDLINGLDYVNIHTVANPGGEVRAQLIQVVNTPPTVVCPEPTTVECTGHEGTSVELLVGVTDANGDQLTVDWAIDGVSQTQIIVPSGGATTAAEVQLVGVFGMGEHTVTVSVSDGVADPVSCEFTVTVGGYDTPRHHKRRGQSLETVAAKPQDEGRNRQCDCRRYLRRGDHTNRAGNVE